MSERCWCQETMRRPVGAAVLWLAEIPAPAIFIGVKSMAGPWNKETTYRRPGTVRSYRRAARASGPQNISCKRWVNLAKSFTVPLFSMTGRQEHGGTHWTNYRKRTANTWLESPEN